MSDFFAPLFDWLALHPHWLGASIFFIILLECTALIGVLWPGAILAFSAALLAGQAGLGLWPLVLLSWLAAFIGNGYSYLLGTRLQGNARNLPLLRRHPQWLAQAEVHLASYGGVSLLIGHFIGPLRPMLPLLAGILRMPGTRFMLTNLSISAIWGFSAMLPGWLAGTALNSAPPDGFWLQASLLAGAFALLALSGFWLEKTARRQRYTLLALLASLLLLILLAGWPWLSTFDLYLQQLILGLSGPTLDKVMLVLTQLGDVKLQIVLNGTLCLLLLLYRARTALIFAATSLMGATVLNAVLKKLVGRIRPDLLPEVLDGYSMPSGHSVRAFTFFLVIAILLGLGRHVYLRISLIALTCIPAGLVAFSRVYLTAHWPTDVLAGALLAMFSCAGTLALINRYPPAPALGHRFWLLQGSLSTLICVLFLFWSFAAAASKYNLL